MTRPMPMTSPLVSAQMAKSEAASARETAATSLGFQPTAERRRRYSLPRCGDALQVEPMPLAPSMPTVGGQPRAAPARPGFLPEDAARLVGWSALFGSPPFPRTALVVLSTPRSASLTASSEGKAAATSGSSKTKLLPLRSRATYLPRTPPFIDAKSYSGRRSLSLCRFALFIELSLAPRRSTGADDADGVVSLRVGHNQDVSPRGCTDCQETGLRL